MKKLISFLLSVSFILTLAACGNDAAPRGQTVNQAATVQDILDNAGASSSESPASPDDTVSWASFETPNANRNQVDPALAPAEDTPRITGDVIDLTQLSSTMVYSEVYNMMASPEDYLGKTVIMEGAFDVYETPERNYYACLIADASACCAQGIEFDLTGDPQYPEDFPELYSTIRVIGTFESYQENGGRYYQLGDASLSG